MMMIGPAITLTEPQALGCGIWYDMGAGKYVKLYRSYVQAWLDYRLTLPYDATIEDASEFMGDITNEGTIELQPVGLLYMITIETSNALDAGTT